MGIFYRIKNDSARVCNFIIGVNLFLTSSAGNISVSQEMYM